MNLIEKLLKPKHVAHAHCDLFCGVYDPAQAKIEALSCLKIAEKYQDSDDEVFRARCISIKEERAELVKHHLSVLWTDFFTDDQFAFENDGLREYFAVCQRIYQHASGVLAELTDGLAHNRQGRISDGRPGMVVKRDQRQVFGAAHPLFL